MPPPVQFDPSKPFTFVEEEKEKKEAEFDPSKPFTFVEEEVKEPTPAPRMQVQNVEGRLAPVVPPGTEFPLSMPPKKEPSDDELRSSMMKSFLAPPEFDPSPSRTQKDWDEVSGNLQEQLEAAYRVRDAESKEEKLRATIDYARKKAENRSNPKYQAMWNPEVQDPIRQEVEKRFSSKRNILSLNEANTAVYQWVYGGALEEGPSDKGLLARFNKKYKKNYTDLGSAKRFLEQNIRSEQMRGTALARKDKALEVAQLGAAFLSSPWAGLEKASDVSGAIVGETLELAAGMQLTPTGLAYRQGEGGKYAEAALEAPIRTWGQEGPSFQELLVEKGVGPLRRGGAKAGSIIPDIVAGAFVTPSVSAFLKARGVPAAAINAYKTPAAYAGVFGGKTYAVTGGDAKQAAEAGLLGALVPGVHAAAKEGTSILIKKMLKGDLSDKAKFRVTFAEEIGGLAGVLSIINAPNMGKYLSASPEEQDAMRKEFLGEGLAFAALARYSTGQRAKMERLAKMLNEKEIQADLKEAFNENWNAREAFLDGSAELARRQNLLTPEQLAEFEGMQKAAREAFDLEVGKPTVEPGVVDPITGRKLRPKKLPPEEGLETGTMKAVRAARQRRLDEQLKAFEIGDVEAARKLEPAFTTPLPPSSVPLPIEPPVVAAPPSPFGSVSEQERLFATRHIERLKSVGQTERAKDFEEHRDIFYEKLEVRDAKETIEDMTDAEWNALVADQKSFGEEWQTLIDIERGRRAEKARDWEAADDIYETLGRRLTTYGQGIQQATTYGMSSRGIVKMVNSRLRDIGAKQLNKKQESKMRELVQVTKDSYAEWQKAQKKYELDRTDANFGKQGELWKKAEESARQQSLYLYNFNKRAWSDIIVTQIQGNLLSPASIILNAGANILMRPIRATVRGVHEGGEAAADLLYTHTLGKLKGTPNLSVKHHIPSPIAGTMRTLVGAKEGLFAEGADWKGAESAWTVLKRGATTNPYEAKGVELSPANSRLAYQQLKALWAGDAVQYSSKLRNLNEYAKSTFEMTFGFPPDVAFRLLYMGDIPFRRAAEYRIIGKMAEEKLAGRTDLTDSQRQHMMSAAMKDPRTMFDKAEQEWIKRKSAIEVYQQDNRATEFIGKYMGAMRRGGVAGKIGHVGFRLLAPYQKTPINVVGEILSYTIPGGIINTSAHGYAIRERGRKKGKGWKDSYLDATEQEKYDLKESAAKLSVAFGIGQVAATMADYGLIQPTMGRGGGDPRKKRLFLETYGVPAGHMNWSGAKRWIPLFMKAQKLKYSGGEEVDVNIAFDKAREAAKFVEGDEVANLARVGSAGAIMLINVDASRKLQELTDEQRSTFEALARAGFSQLQTATQYMTGVPYTQQLGEIYSWAAGNPRSDAASFFSKMGETLTAIGVPRTFGWYDMMREENRPTYRHDTLVNQLLNKWQAKLDSVWIGKHWAIGKHRDELPVILDFRGREAVRTPNGKKYVLGQEASPAMWHWLGMSKHREQGFEFTEKGVVVPDAASAEMLRLHEKFEGRAGGPDMTLLPSPILPTISETLGTVEQDYELTPKQYEDYQKLIGRLRFEGLDRSEWRKYGYAEKPPWEGLDYMVSNSSWLALDDKDKAKTIRRSLRFGFEKAKERYLRDNRHLLKKKKPKVGLRR